MIPGVQGNLLNILDAQFIHTGAQHGVTAVYFGADRIWHRKPTTVHLHNTTDQIGEVWLTWEDTIHYMKRGGDNVYFEKGGHPMEYVRGPGRSPTVHMTSGSVVDFALTPDHGYGSTDTLFHVRTTANRRITASYDGSSDPILLTVHLIPMPMVRRSLGQPASFHLAQQQELQVYMGRSYDHTDDIFYFYNDTRKQCVPENMIGGLTFTTQSGVTPGSWYVYGFSGTHTFKFWNQGLGDHISLRVGAFGQDIATDGTSNDTDSLNFVLR